MSVSRIWLAGGMAILSCLCTPSQAQGGDPGSLGGTIRLERSRTVIRTWSNDGAAGYAISFDGGGEFITVPNTSYNLLLRYEEFDPVVGEPEIPPHLQSAGGGAGGVMGEGEGDANEPRTFIVQFVTQPLDEYRRDIADAGGVIYNFLANHAYLVQMTEAARDEVARLPYVRWIGEYHAAYKLDEPLLAALRDPAAGLPAQRYNIQVLQRGLAHKQSVAVRVNEVGGQVVAMIPDGFIIEAELDGAQLLEIARMHEVHFIDRWSPPENDMNTAREIGGGNYIETIEGFTGEGVRGEVLDDGLRNTHVDFLAHPPLLHGSFSFGTSHGTATFGINFGSGTGNAAGRGMVPDAQGIFADYGFLFNRYQHTAELVQSPYFAVYQSNSWGDDRTTQYTTISHQMDDILFINDIIICQSQSNAGNQNSRPQAWAKNIVSVGGVKHEDTLSKTDDHWGGGNSQGSTGPAADGRIKPDLTHFYDDIFTTHSDSDSAYTSTFGGTSGATPITAGHFGIFFQMWHNGVFGNQVDDGGTVFSNRPHMATAKAMMINSASPYDWTQGGSNGDITRFRQGWGMADLRRMHDRRDSMFIIDEATPLRNLEQAQYDLTVASATPELRITMVYTDLPGTTSSTQHRINDLSLKVTAPDGTIYWGNNGLVAGIWSLPGGGADTKNTVENVFIQNPEAGSWTVTILAAEVVQDAHVETQAVDADFALVASGVTPSDALASIADVEVVFGTLIAGGVAEVSDSDDVRLRARSNFGFSASEPNLVDLHVGLIAPQASPDTLDLLEEGRLIQSSGTLRVRLRTWSTGLFGQVGQFPVGPAETVRVIEGVSAADRVRSSDRRIEVSLRYSVIATFAATGFVSQTDHVQVMVH